MSLTVLLISLFVCFLVVFGAMLPGASSEAVRLGQVTRELRAASAPAGDWRTNLNAETLARPFTPIRRMFSATPQGELIKRLILAGYRKPACADIFIGVRLALPVVLGLLVAFCVQDNTVMWFFFAIAVGYFGPDFWLGRKIARRQDAIRLSLPDALDLLAICMEAGLGLDQGIVRVGQELRVSHPQLSEELLQINFEQRAGVPRSTAWRGLSDRANVESVRSFVAMLIQTDRFGTPLSKSLSSFSDALRTQRRQQAEERAAKTTIKLVPPLVFFIFPSVGVVLVGPAALTLMKNVGHLVQ